MSPSVEDLEDAVKHAHRVGRAPPRHAFNALHLRRLGEGVREDLRTHARDVHANYATSLQSARAKAGTEQREMRESPRRREKWAAGDAENSAAGSPYTRDYTGLGNANSQHQPEIRAGKPFYFGRAIFLAGRRNHRRLNSQSRRHVSFRIESVYKKRRRCRAAHSEHQKYVHLHGALVGERVYQSRPVHQPKTTQKNTARLEEPLYQGEQP